MRKLFVLVAVVFATPVFAQESAKEILTLNAAQLVEIVKNKDAPVFDKAKACQRLAVVGTKDAVPALAALLSDEKLNVYARFGLEGIPDPAADAALRDAATKLQGRPLVGVIDSIGQRKDAKAVELLKGLLANSDAAVASAAAGALGRIGTSEAAANLKEALAQQSANKTAVADACLACAEGLAASGQTDEAVALLKNVSETKVPKHVQIAAIAGQLRLLKGDAATQLLVAQLQSEDDAFFNLGLAAARELPGEEATTAIGSQIEKLQPHRQALVLLALGDRREFGPLQLGIAASRVTSEHPEVREAAIRVLAKANDASATPILLAAAFSQGEVGRLAQERLKTLQGAEVDTAIVAKLAGANAKEKCVLFNLVGARRIAAADPTVRSALADDDETVRIAAIGALGQLVDLKDLELLTSRALGGTSPAETAAAKTALTMAAMRMSDPEGCAAQLAAKLEGATVENQIFLLELLGKVSGRKALETLIVSVKSDYPEIKDAATRVLGEWVNADASAALLEIARHDPENKYQVRALRGYIRIARQLQLPAETKLGMFRTAMEVAKRDDEKQLALDILTRIPSAATLELAVSYLGQPTLKDAAAEAAVKIGPTLIGTEPKSVAAAMQKVGKAGVTGSPGDRAKQLLAQAQASSK